MKIKMNKKGFTLIELLIVIAIIAILAAIAIPQFAAYRLRAFNTSAISDLHNVQNSEANMFADWQRFGRGDQVAAPGPGGGGQGAAIVVVVGPGSAAATPYLTLTDAGATVRGLQFAVGNGVRLEASTNAAALGNPTMFAIAAKHDAGDTCYAADSDTTGTYRNNVPANCGVNVQLAAGTAVATAALDFAAPNWNVM